jgi:hypothetical protein
MTDFSWVQARRDCSLDQIFADLKNDANLDTDERNRIKLSNEFGFKLTEAENRAAFTITLERNRHGVELLPAVTFTFAGDHILVERSDKKNPLRITPTINNERQCRLKINDAEPALERWQVLRTALEWLFFEAK